jgi:hypothetical protein
MSESEKLGISSNCTFHGQKENYLFESFNRLETFLQMHPDFTGQHQLPASYLKVICGVEDEIRTAEPHTA